MPKPINTTPTDEILTQAQFRSLHKLFDDTAKEMNENGITMSAVLQKFILEVPATKYNVKEMWKILQVSMFGTESTKKLLKKQEIDQIYDALNKFLSEKFGVSLPPFPSWEEQRYR